VDEAHALRVAPDEAGLRLDAWLARRLPALSRSRIQALIADGHVRLAGAPARAAARVRAGQSAVVTIPAASAARPRAEDIPLRVVYEDAQLLVVDKPAGLVVHPGAGVEGGTLVNALLARVRDLSGVGGVLRPGIVHRLDRGTSGLIVVAKDDETHRALARQFATRTVDKEYLALVLGVPAAGSGQIAAPIGRDPLQRKRMSTRAPRGREARTSWTLVERFDGAALLRVRIHTGRTHQVRVHLASIGHPVAGDSVYGGTRAPSSRSPAAREALASLTRPALHAARLAFAHPASGRRLAFEAALPADLEQVLGALRAVARAGAAAIIPAMPPSKARVRQHRRVYDGRVISLDVDQVSEPGGVEGTREVVRQSGSVATLPVQADGRIVLVRQYRYAVDEHVWELPAGRRDPHETPEAGARRELEEEVGLRAGSLEPLLVFWTTPGFCDEVMHLFRATDLEPVPARPEADERIEQATVTLAEALAMVRRGEVREGKTLVALLLEASRPDRR
jgi:23S rRNA pseudouridine1911/1915/1917 synthase